MHWICRFIIATLAAIVASQALISAVFQIVYQAITQVCPALASVPLSFTFTSHSSSSCNLSCCRTAGFRQSKRVFGVMLFSFHAIAQQWHWKAWCLCSVVLVQVSCACLLLVDGPDQHNHPGGSCSNVISFAHEPHDVITAFCRLTNPNNLDAQSHMAA